MNTQAGIVINELLCYHIQAQTRDSNLQMYLIIVKGHQD